MLEALRRRGVVQPWCKPSVNKRSLEVKARLRSTLKLRPSGTPRLTPRAAQRRTSSVVTWLVAGSSETTLLARRRPPTELGQMHRIVIPRGLPGIGIVRSAFGRREVVPAQCRARHAPVSRLSGVLSASGFGVEESPGHGADVIETGFELCRIVATVAGAVAATGTVVRLRHRNRDRDRERERERKRIIAETETETETGSDSNHRIGIGHGHGHGYGYGHGYGRGLESSHRDRDRADADSDHRIGNGNGNGHGRSSATLR